MLNALPNVILGAVRISLIFFQTGRYTRQPKPNLDFYVSAIFHIIVCILIYWFVFVFVLVLIVSVSCQVIG